MNKLLASVLLLVLVVPASGAEDESKAVLAKAQGTWVGPQKMDDKTYRMEKTIEGNKETVCLYDGDKLAHKWTVDFEIKKTDAVTIFTFRNLKVIEGPQKGTTIEGPLSYLFQIRDDKWIQVFGMMNGDKGEAQVNTLERKKARANRGSDAK